MKKNLFSLLLNAAIFTTTPLFAMEEPEKGNITSFVVHNKDAFQLMIGYLKPSELARFSQTSTSLNAVCQLPFYESQATIWGIALMPTDALRNRIFSYRDSFRGEQEKYTMTIGHLKSIAATPLFSGDMDLPTWQFSMGNKHFSLETSRYFSYILSGFDQDATLTFLRSSTTSKRFNTTLLKCGLTAGVKDLSSPEYQAIAQNACDAGNYGVPANETFFFQKSANGWSYLPGSFTLIELDDEAIPEEM